jgi:ubiquinone/menaquinone biosynthesis C-methylase UbiE
MNNILVKYLLPEVQFIEKDDYIEIPVKNPSEGLKANAYYFSHPEWAQEYLTYCHRSERFKNRWLAAIGDWTDKIVLDIGCGPGNLFATLQGKPELMIGVDVAAGSLKLATALGYTGVLADATHLPFKPEFADIVALNAALHHCEDMATILKEAAKMVKPGGLLITDHDPQLSAWDYKGPAKLLWNARLYIYRLTGHSFHKKGGQQSWALKSEIHHQPGHGVTKTFFKSVLEPLGFDVAIYPHNHEVGAEALEGVMGKAEWKYRLGNILSGRNPNADTSALSLMCVSKKR